MRVILFLIMFSVCCLTRAQTENFSQIAVQLDANQSLPLSNKVSFEIEVFDSELAMDVLDNWENVNATQVDANHLTVTITEQPRYSGVAIEEHLADSFVIDFKEESITNFVSDFKNEISRPWSLEVITKYVHEYITKPTYEHGFNIASIVAEQRSGDCTEYAVLLTALARSLGLPSRVIFGSVVAETEGRVLAYGHAWSEVFFNEQWHIADAALYDEKVIQTFYVPAGELDNEGPGFSLSLFSIMNAFPNDISKFKDL